MQIPFGLHIHVNILGVQILFAGGDHHGASDVAGHVDAGAGHIQDTLHAHDNAHRLQGQAHGGKHHTQHYRACAGYAGGADGSQGSGKDDGQHLAHGQVNAIYSRYKQGADPLEGRGAVHIDGGAQGEHKGTDLGRYA